MMEYNKALNLKIVKDVETNSILKTEYIAYSESETGSNDENRPYSKDSGTKERVSFISPIKPKFSSTPMNPLPVEILQLIFDLVLTNGTQRDLAECIRVNRHFCFAGIACLYSRPYLKDSLSESSFSNFFFNAYLCNNSNARTSWATDHNPKSITLSDIQSLSPNSSMISHHDFNNRSADGINAGKFLGYGKFITRLAISNSKVVTNTPDRLPSLLQDTHILSLIPPQCKYFQHNTSNQQIYTKLVKLFLANCENITSFSLISLIKVSPCITHLDISGLTCINDTLLDTISTSLTGLQYLSLAHSSRVENAALERLCIRLGKSLKSINLSACNLVEDSIIRKWITSSMEEIRLSSIPSLSTATFTQLLFGCQHSIHQDDPEPSNDDTSSYKEIMTRGMIGEPFPCQFKNQIRELHVSSCANLFQVYSTKIIHFL
jgi:hypothetical protein